MLPRQKDLFKHIIEEYIKTAQPVGSKLIVEKFKLDISPATVRNDMVELEEQDLIVQPHTSAGRIPTEHGYKYYITNHVDFKKELTRKEEEDIDKQLKSLKQIDKENYTKGLAKIIADKSGLGVFVGFATNDVYYTGLSNIFSQPEFQDLDLVYNLSSVIDHLDEVMGKIYHSVADLEVKVGKDNPFARDCASVVAKFNSTLFGLIGPMRMNYERNVALMNFIKKNI